jgi:4,5-DOPA dioxygenase extradiol
MARDTNTMKRRKFLLELSGGLAMTTGLGNLRTMFRNNSESERMPVIFIGHGSPMNAIEDNMYTRFLNTLGGRLPRPQAILVVSAHWITKGTWITQMPNPKTIHDFYGFPQALFDIQYPAPGNPEIAKLVQDTIHEPKIFADEEKWGLDHGTWSVLRHIYPKADIPVLQLSIDMAQSTSYHFKLGQELHFLREKGVLILGSGNLVHNLRRIRWEPNAQGYDWAVEFDDWLKRKLIAGDYDAVLNEFRSTEAGRLSVPTLDHYLPLHYVLGAANNIEELKFEYEEIQNGSISMRSLSIGLS